MQEKEFDTTAETSAESSIDTAAVAPAAEVDAESAQEGSAKKQKRGLALDLVPVGSDEENSKMDKRVTKHLPPEVTSKMLYGDIVHIAWPSLVELTLTQLASMVDLMMVGQLGAWAITSVGLTTQPKFLLMTMFMALNVGATAMVARYKGAGRRDKANEILRQALAITVCIGLVASVVGFIFAEPLVQFMGAETPEVLAGGTTYLRIQMIGLTGVAVSSVITATLRGVGNSRTAMIYNLTANVINVIFNYLLIYGHFGFPELGVAGASLATIIGQFVAMFMALAFVIRPGQYLTLNLKEKYHFNKTEVGKIVDIGIPAMIEQLVMRAGMIIYSKTVASLGTVAFATHQVCMNIQALSFMNGQAFAVSATSLMGQSLGKKRPDMAQAYTQRTRMMGMSVSLFLAFVFFFFGRNIVALYSGGDMAIVEAGAVIMMMVAFMQPFQSSQFILAGALRGAGDTRMTAVITFITVLLVRPGLAILFTKVMDFGLNGAWYAMVIDQILRSVLVIARFNTGRWKDKLLGK